MRRLLSLILSLLATVSGGFAQWHIQDSNTKANLRGIHAVNDSVAWASGTDGTILRTLDGGAHWQKCATPPDAGKLDFRGVWAADSQTALVLSSGPGDQSRVYRTTDACAHWIELDRNHDPDGFWDALVFPDKTLSPQIAAHSGILVGDPVHGVFELKTQSPDHFIKAAGCTARPDEAAFAASNSSAFVFSDGRYVLGTGGKGGPRLLIPQAPKQDCLGVAVPVATGNDSSGVFSLAFRDNRYGIAVGGDYKKPDGFAGTAAWTANGGHLWTAAKKPPHGYRSSVAWDRRARVWIAAGTNGSDMSRDDGRTWQPLDNGNWNALSLPYVVGPGGRIGKLDAKAIKPE